MYIQPNRTRRVLIRLGIPTLFACAAAAALLLWESHHPMSAPGIAHIWTSGTGEQQEADKPHGAGGEEAVTSTAGTQRHLHVTDLLADPAFIETGPEGPARYVSLTDDSGLWAISNPVRLFGTGPGAWEPGRGLPFAGRTVNLSLHEQHVRHCCVFVDVETASAFTMRMAVKGLVETCDVPAGRSLVETDCIRGELARDSLYVSLQPVQPVPPDARPVVKGAWIVPKGEDPPATPPPRPEACGTSGIAIEPSTTLRLRTLTGPGDTLEMQAAGTAAVHLSLHIRSNPGGKRTLAGPGSASGPIDPEAGPVSWPLDLDRQLPVEVEVSLPADAPEAACLERLDVVHPPPDPPVLASDPPGVDGVVVVLLDTLRADAAAAFNMHSPVETPVLEDLARESLVFEDATAHANYTKPSVGTILTGVYPHANGSLAHKGMLSSNVTMVSEMLEAAGIETQGLFSNRFLTQRFGFMRGWGVDIHVNAYKACVSGDIVSQAAEEMLAGWNPEGPFFLYIHLMDPHAPYDPAASFEVKYVGHRVLDGRFTPRSTSSFITNLRRGKVEPPDETELKILKGLYRGDVAAMDGVVGQILWRLKHEGILDRSLLIVTSDHGEEFMEHGWLGHGTNIHPELIHIPLLVRFPGGSPRGRIRGLVGHLDIVPTILDALDVEPLAHLRGRSLLEHLSMPSEPSSPPSYLIEHWNGTNGLRLGQWMVIAHRKSTSIARLTGQKLWYQDPGRNPVKWLYLRERLALLILENRDGKQGKDAKIDTTTKSKLEALGYILSGKDGASSD